MRRPSQRTRRRRGLATKALSFGLVLGSANAAHAAGLYFSERGVRPLGRGGAFVAGADDLGAIVHNPAGIYDAGASFLIDAAWLNFSSDYTRKSLVRQVDPNTGQTVGTFEQTFDTVEGSSPVLPIPTIAASFMPHEDWVIAGGIWAPYSAITSYPEEVGGEPAPQRYSLITLDGSALAIIGGWAAWAPRDDLRLGLGVEVLAGTFSATSTFSGCVPDRFFCAPEQPEWDVLAELQVGPIVAPSGNLGGIWEFAPGWRVGGAFQLPFYIRSGGTIRTRLPSAPPFDGAEQVGEDVDVSFDLPWSMRLGVESRALVENLRVELAFIFERWSMLEQFTISPDNISLRNVGGFPRDYFLPEVILPRNFQDTIAIRGGGEYMFPFLGEHLTVRAGGGYETSAVPPEHLTVLTIDAPKITAALGGSLHVGDDWRFDLTFAHVFAQDVDVPADEARAAQISPIDANASDNPTYVNGGLYEARANVFGVGLVYTFDASPRKNGTHSDDRDEEPAGAGDDAAAGAGAAGENDEAAPADEDADGAGEDADGDDEADDSGAPEEDASSEEGDGDGE